jgi:phosphoglycolate phosphatase-like HAD superfamily hydrolase
VDLLEFDIAVFDMDGTLYSTDNSVVPAVLTTFEEFDLPPPPVEEIEDLIGRPDTHYHEWLRTKGGGGEMGERLMMAVDAKERELVGQQGSLYPNAKKMLVELRRMGVRTALLTNAGRSYCFMVLRTFEMEDLFDAVSYHEGGSGDKAERLARLIEDFGGGPAIMVGDRFYDFEAASQVGCTSVGVSHGFGNEELEAADIVVHGLWGIVELKLRAMARKGNPCGGD